MSNALWDIRCARQRQTSKEWGTIHLATMGSFTTYMFMLVGLLLAIYVNYPAPSQMSSNLVSWKTTSSNTIIFNRNRIFYKDQPGNKPSAPILLCLHGFPTSSYDWLKVWPALLGKFSRVIAPDFLGFGFSDKPLDHAYSITEQADLVEHLLHYQRVREVHILAHDYGDTVAQELLARYEDRLKTGVPKLVIKSVCLLNGGIFPETNFPLTMQRALQIPYLGQILERVSNIYTFRRGFGDVFGPRTLPTDPEFQDFWALIRKNDGHLVVTELLQYIPERTANKYRWTGVLQKSKVPVHVIYGPADPVNPPGFVDFYKEIVPNPSIVVLEDHIGHYPQWEDSAECMSAYFTFIKTLPFSGNEPNKPQATPDVTVSHKRTGQIPPPKVVVEKMKAREREQKAKMEEEKAKLEKAKETAKSTSDEDKKSNVKKDVVKDKKTDIKKNVVPKQDHKQDRKPHKEKAGIRTEGKRTAVKTEQKKEDVKNDNMEQKPIEQKPVTKVDAKQKVSNGKPTLASNVKPHESKPRTTADVKAQDMTSKGAKPADVTPKQRDSPHIEDKESNKKNDAKGESKPKTLKPVIEEAKAEVKAKNPKVKTKVDVSEHKANNN